jgi:antirestriction protein ArdC
VAELTSSFVGVNLNLPTDIPNHANYIGHWLEILKEDKRAVFRADRARSEKRRLDSEPASRLSQRTKRTS